MPIPILQAAVLCTFPPGTRCVPGGRIWGIWNYRVCSALAASNSAQTLLSGVLVSRLTTKIQARLKKNPIRRE